VRLVRRVQCRFDPASRSESHQVRKAIQNLTRLGFIQVPRGKQRAVLHPKITQEDMQSLGRNAFARVLDKQTFSAGNCAARQLASTRGSRSFACSGFE
jgi:hypothetical protein